MDSEQQDIIERYARQEKTVSEYAFDGVGATANNMKEYCGISTNVIDFTSADLSDHFEHVGGAGCLQSVSWIASRRGSLHCRMHYFFDGRSVFPETVTPIMASLTIFEMAKSPCPKNRSAKRGTAYRDAQRVCGSHR